MNARLWPVCPASGERFTAYAGKARPDAEHKAPCPVCCKTVKLRQQSGDRGRNTIPHHHATPNEENMKLKRAASKEGASHG